LNKTGGAYAISGPVQMGTGSGSPHLRTYQPNQFAPGVVMVGANPWTQWARFDLLGNDQTLAGISGETGGLVIQNGGAGIAASGDATLTVNGDADSYFGGHMRDTDGTGGYTLGLVKEGAGALTLAGSVITYTGPTTVASGTLRLTNTTGFNSSIANSATVEIDAAAAGDSWNLNPGRTLSGSGTWIKTGPGRASLRNTTVTAGGLFQIQNGTVRNDYNSGNWSGSTLDMDISSGGVLDLYADDIYVDSLTGAGTVQSGYPQTQTLYVGVDNGSGTFSGQIRGNSTSGITGNPERGTTNLEKRGTGTQTLSGVNTYGGTTTIAGGTLKLQAPATTVPGSIGGLVVHLDANDVNGTGSNPADCTQIGTWVNLASPGTGDLTGSTLPYVNWTGNPMNGNSVVHFWGSSLANSVNYGNDTTVMYVGRMDGGVNRRLLDASGNNWLLGYWGGGMDKAYYVGWLSNPSNSADYLSHLYEGTVDAGGNGALYNNGVLLAGPSPGFTGPNGMRLGGGNEWSYGDVGELLVFDHALTPAERLQMEQYLQAKWYGVLPATTAVDITASGATLDLNGVNQTIGSLAGVDSSQVLLNGGWLTIGQNQTGTTFSGAIGDGSTPGGGLSKVGGGTLTLAGTSANTFTGPTVISQGQLALSKTAGVTAIPGDILMLNSLSPTVWATADNQLGGSGVLSFANEVNTLPGYARFNLRGTTQSVAGIVETDAYRAGVIQNSETTGGAPANSGTSTLVLAGSGDYSFNGYLRNGTYGVLSLSKTGSGTQTLVGDRISYTGDTTVTGGKLIFSNTTALGAGTINNSAMVAFLANGTAYGVPGRLSGGGTYEVDGPGGGNQYQNRVVLRGDGADNTGTINVINSGKLWLDRGINAIGDASTVNVGASGSFFLYSAAGSDGYGTYQVAETIGGLAGSGNVYGHWVNGPIAPVLTVGGGNVSSTFNGTIGEYPGTIAGLKLVKTGSGTLTLSGNNTYAGTTNVNAGTLLLNGQHTGGGLYTVAAGATLGGTGTTTAPVDLSGAVAPGASVGTLGTGGQTWNDGGSFAFEINDVDDGPGTGWDLLNVTGSLDLTGLSTGGFEIDVASLGPDDLPGEVHDFKNWLPYEWEFVRTSEGITGFDELDFAIDASAFANPLSNISSFIVYERGNSLYLGHHVPEPSTLVLAALGLLGLGLAGWRRRRK